MGVDVDGEGGADVPICLDFLPLEQVAGVRRVSVSRPSICSRSVSDPGSFMRDCEPFYRVDTNRAGRPASAKAGRNFAPRRGRIMASHGCTSANRRPRAL